MPPGELPGTRTGLRPDHVPALHPLPGHERPGAPVACMSAGELRAERPLGPPAETDLDDELAFRA
jgi:hypothetical protein